MRKPMRKLIASLLTLCLLLGLSSTALAVSFDIVKPEGEEHEEYAISAALYQGRLLVQRQGSLNEVNLENGQLSPIAQTAKTMYFSTDPKPAYSFLLAENDTLLGYDETRGMLFPLTIGDQSVTLGEGVQLDMSRHKTEPTGEGEQAFVTRPEQMVLMNGKVFALFRDFQSGSGDIQFSSFDIKTGQETTYDSQFVLRIAKYKDGKLLVLTLDEANAWDPDKGEQIPPSLGVFDPETGKVEELARMQQPYRGDGQHLAYDAQRDIIYNLMPNKLFLVAKDGKEELAAYFPVSAFNGMPTGMLTPLPDGRVAVACGEGVYLRTADPAKLPATTLTVYGGYQDDAHKKAAAKMAGVPITFLDNKYYSKAAELGQALVSGEDGIDVLFLDGSYFDIKTLMDKGYTYDLSGSQKLSDFVSQLYPKMQEVAKKDGKLLLIPISVNLGEMLSCNEKYFEETGLSIPHTFQELVDLINTWAREKATQFPDYQPMTNFDYRTNLAYMMYAMYADQMIAKGQPLRFDTPEFRQLAQILDQLDAGDLDQKVDWSDPNAQTVMEELFNKKTLMDRLGGVDATSLGKNQGDHTVYVQVKPTADAPEVNKVNLRYLAINPRSKNLELAVQFAEHYVESLSGSNQLMLKPEMNDPIPNPYYEQYVKSGKEYEDSLLKGIEKAQGPEKAELQSNLDSYRKSREENDENMRYSVNEAGIKLYREMMKNFYIASYDDLILWNNNEIQPLLMRYLQKQITLDQFIQEADGKLRLIQLENQ